ncbi:hypothetical protein TWF696_009463 [Orbilia brochopaga]|uniref:Apple domain-containing protein n=1 Tax=Orbilia brochopaga TaxID=3140254 RepID=A0AAV9UAP1_9PEZI
MKISRIPSYASALATIISIAQGNPLPVDAAVSKRYSGTVPPRDYCVVYDEWWGSTSSGYAGNGAEIQKTLKPTEDAARCKELCDNQIPSSATGPDSTCGFFNYYIQDGTRKCIMYPNEQVTFASAYNSPLRGPGSKNKYPSSGYQVLSATNTRARTGWTYECFGSKVYKTLASPAMQLTLPPGPAPTTFDQCIAACDTFTENAKAAGSEENPAVKICNYAHFFVEYSLAYNLNSVVAYHCQIYRIDPLNAGGTLETYSSNPATADHWYGESIGYKHTTYEAVGADATWDGGYNGEKWYSNTAAEQHEFTDTTP